MLFEEILGKLRVEVRDAEEKAQEAYDEQKKALSELHGEMKSLMESKKSSVKEYKRFGKEFQSVFKFFEEENQQERLNEKFPNRVSRQQQVVLDKRVKKLDVDRSGGRKVDSTLNERNLQELRQDVERYDNTFKQLMEETKTNHMNQILQTFDDYEEENYAIFKYINELSDELEYLQRVKRKLEVERRELEDRPTRRKEDPRVQKQEMLVKEIDNHQRRREKYDQNYRRLMKIMLSLKVSVPIMFERIGCNQEEYLSLLGDNFVFRDIDEDGVIRLLGVIEKRTNDILQMQGDTTDTRSVLETKNIRLLEDSYQNINKEK